MEPSIPNFNQKISKFVSTIYCVQQTLSIKPENNHISMVIEYFQILQKRKEFLVAMFNTIIRFVYTDEEQKEFLKSMESEAEESEAWMYLMQDCKDKFRICNMKGQFSELLLYNMLIHLFNAVPAVRKMKITTNPKLERNGADAIHIGYNNVEKQYEIYIGEAKTYTSGFKAALCSAIKSIELAYKEHLDELNLYRTPKFLDPVLASIIMDYMDNKLPLKTNLVVLISYCCGNEKSGANREEIIKEYLHDVAINCQKVKDADYPVIDGRIFNNITYIFFPVNELEELVTTFTSKFA